MAVFTVTIAFESSARTWLVRRAHTVVETHVSDDAAIRAACEMAVALREHMHCNVRIRLRDKRGCWHVVASMNDDRSASAMAWHMRCKLRPGTPGPGAHGKFATRAGVKALLARHVVAFHHVGA